MRWVLLIVAPVCGLVTVMRPPGRRRRHQVLHSTTHQQDVSSLCRERRSNYEALPVEVPLDYRGKQAPGTVFRLQGLDDIFPGKGLSDAFADPEFRHELRIAGRQDLGGDELTEGVWKDMGDEARQSYRHLDKLLEPYDLTGRTFIYGLTDCRLILRAKASTGIWTEEDQEGWHQEMHDVLKWTTDRAIVILGFPTDDYDPFIGTTGVFPHLVRLSHVFLDMDTLDMLKSDPTAAAFDDNLRIVPRISRGNEILIFSDVFNFHTRPDLLHRDGIWLFR